MGTEDEESPVGRGVIEHSVTIDKSTRVSAGLLVALIGYAGAIVASWYELSGRVQRVDDRLVSHFSESEPAQNRRIDQLVQDLYNHIAQPGHPVAIERWEASVHRMDSMDARMDRIQLEINQMRDILQGKKPYKLEYETAERESSDP